VFLIIALSPFILVDAQGCKVLPAIDSIARIKTALAEFEKSEIKILTSPLSSVTLTASKSVQIKNSAGKAIEYRMVQKNLIKDGIAACPTYEAQLVQDP
jgi:hypothetical protein